MRREPHLRVDGSVADISNAVFAWALRSGSGFTARLPSASIREAPEPVCSQTRQIAVHAPSARTSPVLGPQLVVFPVQAKFPWRLRYQRGTVDPFCPTPAPSGLRETAAVRQTAMKLPTSAPFLGELSERFKVRRLLGAGGMNIVLEAEDAVLGRPVAVKLVRCGHGAEARARRLLREAKTVSRLRSEHVARVLDIGWLEPSSPFIVVELLVGLDLAALLRAEGVMSPRRALRCMLRACEALIEAHAVDVIHRDLKPSNLFAVDRPGFDDWIKVLDFGLAKELDVSNETASLTGGATLLGTPRYMAPEQFIPEAELDQRTDVWGAAITLYELLTGRLPFDGRGTAEIVQNILSAPPRRLRQDLPHAPAELELLLLRCIEKSPEQRLSSMTQFAAALTRLLSVVSEHASRAPGRPADLGRSSDPDLSVTDTGYSLPADDRRPTPRPMRHAASGSTRSHGLGSSAAPARARYSKLGWLMPLLLIGAVVATASLHWAERDPRPKRVALLAPTLTNWTTSAWSVKQLASRSPALAVVAVGGRSTAGGKNRSRAAGSPKVGVLAGSSARGAVSQASPPSAGARAADPPATLQTGAVIPVGVQANGTPIVLEPNPYRDGK
jgi:serine/threonine protein kinase